MLSPRDKSDTTTRTAPPRGERYARNQALINQRAKLNVPPNAAVQRPRDHVSSTARVRNEMTHMRRARDAV